MSRSADLDVVEIYCIALAGLFLALVLWRQSWRAFRAMDCLLRGRIRRHLTYPRVLPGYHQFLNPKRSDLGAHLLHYATTAICNAYEVRTTTEAASRAGKIAVVHLAILLAAPQPNVAAALLSTSTGCALKLHMAIGIMATLQGSIHAVLLCRTINLMSLSAQLSITVSDERQGPQPITDSVSERSSSCRAITLPTGPPIRV